jgi:bifunctional non-homologous end joining protein LigD
MPLEEYRRKRDFAKTPEPAGVPGAGSGRFVVQRHRATRLHYDVRLEIGGVLVSWAVPKGPTLDPAERRMAVHVEDHPVEYFDFEGVIPPRQYGAGDVIVWDWGTFEPEATDDPAAAIAAGELKFRLHGEKLTGRFTIVRTSGRGHRGTFEREDAEQWLLIHKRDESAVPGWDPEDHPRSVKTGRTNDEVRANRDALWVSAAPVARAGIDLSAAVEGAMPTFVEPMLATLSDRPFDDPDWLFEVKWDGYRVEAVVRAGAVRLHTRNGNDAETYFPGLLSPPSWIDAREAIVDGEVVAVAPDGTPSFELLQGLLGGAAGPGDATLVYQAFDLLYLDGRSLTSVPLEDRKRLLRSVLREQPRVRFASHVERDGIAFHAAAAERGLEGVVAKRRRSPYEPGRRTTNWLKLKIRPEQEFVVGGYVPGKGTHADLGALLLGVHEGSVLRYAGRVGSGIDARTRRDLRARLDATVRETAPFDPAPARSGDLRDARWAEPRIVVRVRFASWTRDGVVRQASFAGIDPDREPPAVAREHPIARSAEVEPAPSAGPTGVLPQAASPAELDSLGRLGSDGIWPIGGRELKLTNLDKVLFPPRDGFAEAALTKRDLIRYFASIAPVMLPHLAGRALNLQRFPNGVGGSSFWQKDIPATAPPWLRRWRETMVSERDANEHLVADEVATLAWLGNQAAFEIHAWTSRIDDLEHPTYALIDIDPGHRTTWDECLVLARLFRTALGHLGVTGFPKLTGKRGIQVWIPIVPRYSFVETSAWVEGVSRAVAAIAPDLVSWEWSVADRKGRARLDYTQNAPIKTLVAPYAVRPSLGAPVSAPIDWNELDDPDLRPDAWTIRTIPPRVAERGDLFAGALTQAQELPAL